MNTYRYLYLIICGLVILFAGCKKIDEVPYTNAPSIAFVSATPTSAKEYKDIITFVVSYKDHDGDLGENDPNVTNVFVTDKRNGVKYEFRVKQLAPDKTTSIAIAGNLDIELPATDITDGSSSQSATFEIYLKDRAGNVSNTITSTAVQIVK